MLLPCAALRHEEQMTVGYMGMRSTHYWLVIDGEIAAEPLGTSHGSVVEKSSFK